jgi:hypothetical protein
LWVIASVLANDTFLSDAVAGNMLKNSVWSLTGHMTTSSPIFLKKVGRKSRVALTPRQVRLARGGASTCKEDVLRETRLCHLDWTRSRRPRLELHEWPAFALHMYRKGIPPSPSSHQPEAESSPSTPPASNCQRPSSKSSHLAATSSNVLPAAATSQTLAADGSGSQQKQPAPSSQHQPVVVASSSREQMLAASSGNNQHQPAGPESGFNNPLCVVSDLDSSDEWSPSSGSPTGSESAGVCSDAVGSGGSAWS